jgi:hypothetical protein
LNDVSDNFPSEGQQEDNQEISRDEQNDVGDGTVSHTQQPVSESDNIRRTRTRVIRRPERLIEVGYSSYYEVLHEDDYKLQDEMTDPIAFLSHHSDPDTMYFHEAMRQPDREDFIKAVIKEINDHIDRRHWILVPREKVPKGTKILDSVWAMKRKRDLVTRQIYKHKARLNVHGGQQQFGVNYLRPTLLLCFGFHYEPYSHYPFSTIGIHDRSISYWHTRKLRSSSTCIWSYRKVLKCEMEIERRMC